MKCTCGKEFVEGQTFCVSCKRSLNKPGFGMPGDKALYSPQELYVLKKSGNLKPDDTLIKFPDGIEIRADSVISFAEPETPEMQNTGANTVQNTEAPVTLRADNTTSSENNPTSLIIIFVVVAVGLYWLYISIHNSYSSDVDTGYSPGVYSTPAPVHSGGSSEDYAPTYSDYLSISEGMSYSEVCSVLGSDGVESTSFDGASGTQFKSYEWEGDMWHINVSFKNDKMYSKWQFGLK